MIIGLVGQVCAGKSAVAEAFRRRGARVWSADKAVHEIYRDPRAIREVVRLFGPEVLNPAGGIDRQALARIVFAGPAPLQKLTRQVIFPRTGRAIRAEVERFRASRAPALVLDAPTLFESGRDRLCDRIVFVGAPLARRQKWARARGWDRSELKRRDQRLGDERLKRRRADAVIRNLGTLRDLDQRVGKILVRWGGCESAAAPSR